MTHKLFFHIACFTIAAMLFGACQSKEHPAEPTPDLPPATPIPSDADAVQQTIRFLEEKVQTNPDDFIAYNKLAGLYLQRLRESGDLQYLNLAQKAAKTSLDVLPAERNPVALGLLAQSEYSSHEFAAALEHARQNAEFQPSELGPKMLAVDALLELGDYEQAAERLAGVEGLKNETNTADFLVSTRLARVAILRGKPEDAERHLQTAVASLLSMDTPPRESVAWCRWQLGEVAFSRGDYETAEKNHRDALTTFPNYYRAVASLGNTLAAKGDLQGAIQQYEQVVKLLPDPTYIATLGDLYTLSGRDRDAATQYTLVEQIARLSALNGQLYNRQLALFYADHDLKPDEAYQAAVREFDIRQDIYGSDAVAWTALKAGKLDEAQAAIKKALRLGTHDARLLYHAGMIARAAGDESSARTYLQQAIDLNPGFDPLQSRKAREALGQ